MSFVYELEEKEGRTIPMKDSFKMAYTIISDLFNEKLGFFLIEPKSTQKDVIRAVPLVGLPVEVESHYMDHFKNPSLLLDQKKQKAAAVNASMNSSMVDVMAPWGKPDSTKTLPSSFIPKVKYSDKRVLEIDSLHKLDLGMKLAISSMPYKDRFTAEQVGGMQQLFEVISTYLFLLGSILLGRHNQSD